MNTTAARIYLDGVPPDAFGVEEDDFQARKRAARPPVLDDSSPEFQRADLRDASEEFAPWTHQPTKFPENPSMVPMLCVILCWWAVAFYALAYYLTH